jgi:hypothetical protein
MALPPLGPPRREWFTTEEAYRYFDLLWRKLGKDDGTLAALVSEGAQVVAPAATGVGSPEGATAAAPGTIYRDTSTDDLYYKGTGSGNTGWKRINNP